MSVFQLQEWWSVKVAEDEEFDMNCFDIGNVDNSVTLTNKIVVGSLKGMLRMYQPTRPNYRVEDLVLEENLEKPILQVAIGRFIPGSEIAGLAVLHPRELVVYEVVPQAVRDDRVSYYALKRIYRHNLGLEGKHFTAFNMTHGAFGGVKGRDMLMVQSLDGKLQIFEQSAHAFSVQLVDCLLPGPLVYVPKLDAFVTVNYAGIAECYRYQALASSSSSNNNGINIRQEGKSNELNALGLRNVRSTLVEWSVNLGEPCRQVLLGNFSPLDTTASSSGPGRRHSTELLFICDKSLFLLKADTGGVIQQRKLERADAACACAIPLALSSPDAPVSEQHNFLLVDHSGMVSVYQQFQLVWACRHPTSSASSSTTTSSTTAVVQLMVTSFASQQGLIVTMDDAGYLMVGYLGTRPARSAALSVQRDLDYDQVDEEHRQLLQVIRDAQADHKGQGGANGSSSSTSGEERVLVKAQVTKTFDLDPVRDYALADAPLPDLVSWAALTHAGLSGAGGGQDYVKQCVRLYFSSTCPQDRPLTNVSVTVSCPDHVFALPGHFVLPQVTGLKPGGQGRATPIAVKLYLFARKNCASTAVVHSTDLSITVSYQTSRGTPCVTSYPITLPSYLTHRPRPPTKNANYKLTLDTGDRPPVSLPALYSDVLYAYTQTGLEIGDLVGGNAVQALGFQSFLQAPPSGSAHHGGVNSSIVSILTSKNAGRYRVQGDSYPALYSVLADLDHRLTAHFTTGDNNNNGSNNNTEDSTGRIGIVTWNEEIPLDEYFALVSQHLAYRLQLVITNAKLNDVSQQFRLVEKRLLTRFKDRNPTPLHSMDVLLQESYDQIITLADEIGGLQKKIIQVANDVLAFTKLLVLLISWKYRFTLEERQALHNYLCPEYLTISSSQIDQGWEEQMTNALQYVVRLLTMDNNNSNNKNQKSAKDSSALGMPLVTNTTNANGDIEIPKNIDPLKKLFYQLLDRLDKGARLPAK